MKILRMRYMPARKKETARRSYLLLMDAGVIACDLTQIILSHDPDATVTFVRTAEAARKHVDNVAALEGAILSLGPAKVAASGLDTAIRAKGGRLHLIGDEADAWPDRAGWSVIDRPFSTESLLAVLNGEDAVNA
jgi:hypothetical protein